MVYGVWYSAAYMARKQGANVILIERTDSLLGTGLVGGIMRNNGRYTATEEMIAMGGGDIFKIIDENIVKEFYHYYFVIKVIPMQDNMVLNDEIYYEISKILLDKKDPLMYEYLKKSLKTIEFGMKL